MANDISYTAIGTFNETQIIVDIALDNTNNNPFRIVEKYDLSRSFGTQFYNAVLLHVDNGTENEVVSRSHSFPAVIDICTLIDMGNIERFDSNLNETLFFVAHQSAPLELNFDDLISKIPDYYQTLKFVLIKNNFLIGRPYKLGISIIRK